MAASHSSPDWHDCPPGEIARVVKSLKQQRRREMLQQAAGISAAILVLVGGVSVWVSGWLSPQSIPRIACKKVHDLAPQFVAGELDGELTVRIDHHLKRCNPCREHFQAEFPQFPLPAQAARPEHCTAVWDVAMAEP